MLTSKVEASHKPKNVEAGKDKETDSPLEPPERNTALLAFDLSLVRPPELWDNTFILF